MTDGHTGFQVAPITEDDMNRVHSILTRAVDAIVGVSQLSKDVEAMQGQMAQMTDELTRLRRTNDALEESLSNSRRNRQDLEAKVTDLQHSSSQAIMDKEYISRELDVTKANLERQTQSYEACIKDRDDAQFEVMELGEELKKSKANLDKVREIFGMAEPLKAVPQEPTPITAADHSWTDPAPATDPTPTPPSPSRTYVDHWEAGAMWDPDRQSYYHLSPF